MTMVETATDQMTRSEIPTPTTTLAEATQTPLLIRTVMTAADLERVVKEAMTRAAATAMAVMMTNQVAHNK
jgi:hypothetical protein